MKHHLAFIQLFIYSTAINNLIQQWKYEYEQLDTSFWEISLARGQTGTKLLS